MNFELFSVKYRLAVLAFRCQHGSIVPVIGAPACIWHWSRQHPDVHPDNTCGRQRQHWSCLGWNVQQSVIMCFQLRLHPCLSLATTQSSSLSNFRGKLIMELFLRSYPNILLYCCFANAKVKNSLFIFFCIVTLKFFGTIRLVKAIFIYITLHHDHILYAEQWEHLC